MPRGGAGNIWQAQLDAKRSAKDVEAQQSVATSITTNVGSSSQQQQQQQYAYSGRGGAGNFYSPSELSQRGTFSSTVASPTSPGASTPTAATASGAVPVELPSAKNGRGGAGNFVWDSVEKDKAEQERRRQEEERVKAQATMDVELSLLKPASIYLPADAGRSM